MFRIMAHALRRALGVEPGAGEGSYRMDWRAVASIASSRASALLLLGLMLSYLWAVMRYPYYLPMDLVEEWAYGYTTSSNFLSYGFMNSGFLADSSNSSFPEDHPYVYTHMPPGPDIVLALILMATGNSYFALRIVLGLAFLVGIWFYYRFAQLILEKSAVVAPGIAVLLVGPIAWAQIMDRSVYVLYPLLGFAPYVALAAYYRSSRVIYLILAVSVAFLSSVYVEYSLLAATVAGWILLYITKLIRIERRHLFCIVGAIVLGVMLHLLQNLLFLGPDIFFKDLLYTLGNRTIGIPGREALRDFYQAESIVHHGSASLDIGNVLFQVRTNLSAPFLAMFVVVAFLGLILLSKFRLFESGRLLIQFDKNFRDTVRFFASLAIWIALTIVVPVMAFPAYSQEVSPAWSGANRFYLAIGQTALLGLALKAILVQRGFSWQGKGRIVSLRLWRDSGRADLPVALEGVGRFLMWLVLVLATIVLAIGLASQFGREYARVIRSNVSANENILLENLRRFGGELYLTNINTPIVGFFTRAPGFGVCDQESISPDGSISIGRCHVSFMRRANQYRAQTPRYFFFFGQDGFQPGFASKAMLEGSGRIALRSRLETRFEKIHENSLFSVFDLHREAKP
jgi:hypothetical protein